MSQLQYHQSSGRRVFRSPENQTIHTQSPEHFPEETWKWAAEHLSDRDKVDAFLLQVRRLFSAEEITEHLRKYKPTITLDYISGLLNTLVKESEAFATIQPITAFMSKERLQGRVNDMPQPLIARLTRIIQDKSLSTESKREMVSEMVPSRDPYQGELLTHYSQAELNKITGQLVLPYGTYKKFDLTKDFDDMPTYLCNAERPYERAPETGKIITTFAPRLKDAGVVVVDMTDGWLYKSRGFQTVESMVETFLDALPKTTQKIRAIINLNGGSKTYAMISPNWLAHLFERAPKLELRVVLAEMWAGPEEYAFGRAFYGEAVHSTKEIPELTCYKPYSFELSKPYKEQSYMTRQMYLAKVTK